MEAGRGANRNIYILSVVALDETLHSRCLHFSMQNIEQSPDLTSGLGGLTLTSANDWLCLSICVT